MSLARLPNNTCLRKLHSGVFTNETSPVTPMCLLSGFSCRSADLHQLQPCANGCKRAPPKHVKGSYKGKQKLAWIYSDVWWTQSLTTSKLMFTKLSSQPLLLLLHPSSSFGEEYQHPSHPSGQTSHPSGSQDDASSASSWAPLPSRLLPPDPATTRSEAKQSTPTWGWEIKHGGGAGRLCVHVMLVVVRKAKKHRTTDPSPQKR